MSKAINTPQLVPTVNEMRKLSFEMAGAMDNCAQLILMLIHVADVPPAVILKPNQRLLIAETVDKVDLSTSSSGSTVKRRRPMRLYLLKDAIIMVKVIKDTVEPFDWIQLFEPGIKGGVKMPKPALQYKDMWMREFVKVEEVKDLKDGDQPIFSLTLNVKKGKTLYFCAPSMDSRDRWLAMSVTEGGEESS
ncbi:hypothetical protein HK104_005484 [Borealophlyctis nickersoniae]|nr:hypothetical protein HK104_005484 [Borealophlyctis nickersoniae]